MNASALIPPLDSNATLIAWIGELTGEPDQEIRQRLFAEERRCGANVRQEMQQRGIRPYEISNELLSFYSETSAFLYESTVWNRTPEKLQMREWIDQRLATVDRPLRILVFGDGPGWDSAFLATCGHDVTYHEVGRLSTSFARRLFEHLSVPVTMVEQTSELSPESFDVVVCLDVLEHVPDPPAFVADFHRWLCPGGLLFSSAPFFLLSLDYSTHLKSNRRYSGDIHRLYGQAGFQLIDGRPFWNPLVFAKDGDALLKPAPVVYRGVLGVAGWILSTGRYWSGPLVWATRLVVQSDPRWREDL